MPKHAFLSASSSHRWLACPPSALLCAKEADQSSAYAKQGSDAHEFCEYLLLKALGHDPPDPTENLDYYDAEMLSCAEGYRDFVMEQVEEARKLSADPLICVEQRLDYSRWVENGFGTGDCVIVADDLLHVIDYKYGLGVLVSASGDDRTGNSQLKCYALGALDTFGDLYDIRRIKLSIYQPRRENVDTFEMPVEDLLRWADDVLSPTAKLAFTGDGEFCAGDHCVFCKVKATCRARADYSMELAKYEFEKPAMLDDEEIASILPMIDSLVSWATDIKEFALQQALSGTVYEGYKVVEGRSNRKYSDEAAVAKIVQDAGYDPFEKKLLGVTAMQRQLGKKKFQELLGGLLYKPPGKPVLVPTSDSRPEFNTAANDFID
ncbi:MAG: DUF2800 domain-containing protein [Lachnospiraceae bacterium]|nr:DUF2800 domain-containing protein [Lachnospiraceae bacterium]